MSAIAGVLSARRVNPDAVRKMSDAQAHRGPESEGFWIDRSAKVAFGHRARHKRDPVSAQPLRDDVSGLTIVLDGAIYNAPELRSRLATKEQVLKSDSDAELVLGAYRAWGEECLHELDGAFAFAIWDERSGTLFCARDRFGERPFLYSVGADFLVFASEAKSLARIAEVDLALHDGVLSVCVDRGASWVDSGEQTLFRGIRQLLPAQALTARLQKDLLRVDRIWSYWSPTVVPPALGDFSELDPAANRLLYLLRESVRRRVGDDSEMLASLGEGIGSATLVGLMRTVRREAAIRTLASRSTGDPNPLLARLVVEMNATKHQEVACTAELFRADVARLYHHADFPLPGLQHVYVYYMSRWAQEAGQGFFLDATGSDDPFVAASESGSLPQRVRRVLARRPDVRRAARAMESKILPVVRGTRIGTFVSVVEPLVGPPKLARACVPAWLESARLAAPSPPTLDLDDENSTLADRIFSATFRIGLSSKLRALDRFSGAHACQLRLPFCDPRIAEFLAGVSPAILEAKTPLLGRAATGIVPNEMIRGGAKVPNPRRFDAWLLGPLASWICELVENAPRSMSDKLDVVRVRELAYAPEGYRKRHLAVLWEATNLLAWGRFVVEPLSDLERLPLSRG